ncbi:MAG: oligoendopeptidase F [Verrucomicrobia bacterium]|nr:oligoendopeptidase F [Verrucomicrobiota bacterium]
MPKSRSEIPIQDRWNVEALYPSPDLWKVDFQKARGQQEGPRWPDLVSYKGKLSDPKVLSSFFEHYFSLDRHLSKLYTYAHLKMDEDLGNDAAKHDYGLITTLLHEFELESSWIEPELLSLSEDEFKRLTAHPSLKPFAFYLEKIGRRKAHTLSPEQEELLALSGKSLDTTYKTFAALTNADMTFKPAHDSKGVEQPLSNGTFTLYMNSPDRELRKNAFLNLHKGYEGLSNTLCELLQGQAEGHRYIAKARKFSSCVEAALFAHRIDKEVYIKLIETVRKHLPAMHQYLKLRKDAMGLSEIHAYDLYVSLVPESQIAMPYADACKAVIESVAPLGAQYQEVLKEGLDKNRWVDVYENPRKRSGAYSSGCYDSMPYILMNYHGTLKDVFTLAHEAGHSMHSFLSRKNQPYVYSHYPIFVAEVASTFNEQLLLNHLLQKAKTKQEKAILINHQLEGIRGTIFRQTLFAEFELQIHQWVEEGTPLTPTLLKEAYLKLVKDYYGPDFTIDPELGYEWARIPHFYYNFYVYQYATGLSAAMALFQGATRSHEARDKYLQFLSSGGTRFPLDLLEIAGVDMKSPKPVEAAMARFQELVAEMQKLL